MNAFPLITILTAVPLIGALGVLGLGAQNKNLARGVALTFSFIALALALVLWHRFNPASGELQFEELHTWIPAIGVRYHVGIDGLGLLMLLLSAIVVPMSMAASRQTQEGTSLYFSLILFLQAGLFGTFSALNFFHWFIFWELSLIPAFFLIRLWGGSNRSRAAAQFFIYTFVGSVTMLLSFGAIYVASGTLDFMVLAEKAKSGELTSLFSVRLGWYDLSTKSLALILFAGVFLAFAVKTPLIPFHTWLPDTYAEAPTGTTIALTGAMSKMGVYGFLRILIPLFPQQVEQLLTPLLWIVIATIVLSALTALAQNDLKRVLAYSSINHLGYCLLGAFAMVKFALPGSGMAAEKAAVTNGVLLQMFNHAITAATLFYFVALMIAMMFFIGIYPQGVPHFINRTAVQLVSQLVY